MTEPVPAPGLEPDPPQGDFFEDGSVHEIRLAAVFRRGFRQAMVVINHALAAHDLSPLQYHLLLEVGAAGSDGCVQGDLAQLLQTPEARVSVMVHVLQHRGLVDTARAVSDRRVVHVGLTRAGSGLVRAALHQQRSALGEMAREFEMPGVTEMLRAAVQLYLGVDITEVPLDS